MLSFKLNIIKYVLWFRFRRFFFSNSIAASIIKNWNKNLLKSKYYKTKQGFYPIVNKSVFMQNFNDINTVSISKKEAFDVATNADKTRNFKNEINGISIGLSSGTSGNYGIFLTSQREKAIWVASILDRVIGFSLKKRKVAFFLRANNNLYESAKSNLLQFQFYDLALPFKQLFKNLLLQNASILVAQPSVLNEIAKAFESQNIKPQFSKIISVAEVLEDDQKKYFEQTFKCKIDQVYQCTEGFLAYTCKNGNLHFNEDFLKIEKQFIDETKERFHPIITDYLRYSQPIVRYQLNDIIHLGKKCNCGSKAITIKKIEGRADDIFRFKIENNTINIYPDYIRRTVIKSSNEITNYVIRKKNRNTISIFLSLKKGTDQTKTFNKVAHNLKAMFLNYGIDNLNFTKSIEEKDFTKKFKRIVNES